MQVALGSLSSFGATAPRKPVNKHQAKVFLFSVTGVPYHVGSRAIGERAAHLQLIHNVF
jgi:hypothetical protein